MVAYKISTCSIETKYMENHPIRPEFMTIKGSGTLTNRFEIDDALMAGTCVKSPVKFLMPADTQ